MSRTAIYRGQRFNVVSENARYVTLEGFGYKKKVQLEEIIFEEEPLDDLPAERKSEELISEPIVEDMPTERVDNDILTQEQIESINNPKKVIKISFENWNDEAASAGDTDDRGWENEDGVDMTPDEEETQEGMTAVDKAVDFLKKSGAVHPSSSHFNSGTWYSTDEMPNYQTGDVKILSFHLAGFDDEEENKIFDALKVNKLKETLAKFVIPPTPESAVTPAPDVSEKVTPDYPKFGLNLSVDTSADRHKENEDRRKTYVSDMKMKLKEMMDKIDEMEVPQQSQDPNCELCTMEESREEGIDFPYETFEKFFDDFMMFAQHNNIVNGQGQINILEALKAFAKEKFVPEFIKTLGGPEKALQILMKKVAEAGELQLTEIKTLEEDGAASAGEGGGVPNDAGVVDVPLKGDGGVSTANVANFNARLGGHIKRDDKLKNITE
jgi:hypothetical protein